MKFLIVIFNYINLLIKTFFVKGNATATIKAESNQFVENESAIFACELNGMDKSQINSVTWFKNENLIEETPMSNVKIDSQNTRLIIKDLSHRRDNGIYHCQIELKNLQIISSNKVEVETRCKF